MRNLKNFKAVTIGSIFALLVFLGTAFSASAQNVSSEYRDWQRAQARAEQEHQDYLRTGSRRDYNQWQEAMRNAQEQYAQYQRAASRYGSGNSVYYSNGNYGNGYYNNGYSNNNRYSNNGRYRLYMNGSYYSTDSRGVELLRQAVRNGYAQGYRQGQMARNYNRGYGFYNNDVYSNGSYGYQSYVGRSQYQYYFQQGFQKGYEDGYYSRNQYGYRSGSSFNILGNVLNTILNLAQD